MKSTRCFFQSILCLILLLTTNLPTAASSTENAPSLEHMAGQMLMIGFQGASVSAHSPIINDIEKYNIGGVILFDYDMVNNTPNRNIQNPKQLRRLIHALQSHAKTPLFIAVDQEGGKVQRLKSSKGFPSIPSAHHLGSTNDLKQAQKAGEIVASTLSELGFNLNFAPSVDVNINPHSPAIGALERSFSHDPDIVATFAKAYIKGLHSRRVLACIKHFPGHGSANNDSHLGVTDVTQTWQKKELIPYKKLLRDNCVDMIMTAHIFNARLDATYPATLSNQTITGILRKELGWQGVVVTDDLDMKAVSTQYGFRETLRLAILAGADILLFGNNLTYRPKVARKAIAEIRSLVEAGAIPMERIHQSYTRIQQLKKKLAVMP